MTATPGRSHLNNSPEPIEASLSPGQIPCWSGVGSAFGDWGIGHSSMNSAVIRVIVTVVVAVGAFGGATSQAQDSRSQAAYVSRARSGTEGEVRVSAAALSDEESAAVYGVTAGRQVDPAGLGRGREQRRRPLLVDVRGPRSRFHSCLGSCRSNGSSRLPPQARGAGSPFRRTGLPESSSSRRNGVGLRPHEPSRGREAPADRSVRGPAQPQLFFPGHGSRPADRLRRGAGSSTAIRLRRMAMSSTLRATRSSWRLWKRCRVVRPTRTARAMATP